jgi:hypothetical protein
MTTRSIAVPSFRPPSAGESEETGTGAEGAPTWAGVAFMAGALTPFTVSLVGEMPVGELVLMAVFGWSAATFALTRRWPSPLLKSGWFAGFMLCQAVALAAYVVSDFYRGSTLHDMARGWGRMVFLALDVATIACFLGRSPRNLLFLLTGLQLGEIAAAVVHGPLFGDWWKFGVGNSITFLLLAIAAQGGVLFTAVAAAGLGLLHFALDFRSVGALCMLVAAMSVVQAFPRRLRVWIVPVGAALALLAVGVVYQRAQADRDGNRAGRSDIDRSSMLQAAWEAFRESPFLGQGSWFSKTDVIDNYLLIRDASAREANIGGFAGPNEEVEGVALHSQILVALAEGGVFGAAFFFIYGAGLAWALLDQVLVRPWRRESPIRLLLLVMALFHLFMSPFSGALRVQIAMAAGLVLLVAWERRQTPGDEEAEEAA